MQAQIDPEKKIKVRKKNRPVKGENHEEYFREHPEHRTKYWQQYFADKEGK